MWNFNGELFVRRQGNDVRNKNKCKFICQHVQYVTYRTVISSIRTINVSVRVVGYSMAGVSGLEIDGWQIGGR